MRKLTFTLFLFAIGSFASGQQASELPEAAYRLYPTLNEMYGYAVGKYEDKIIVLGGLIRSDVPELYKEDFPNTEILLIDLGRDRASAFSSGAFEGILGEQLAASGLAYYQKDNTLYILGGYGYSETHNRFITFPYLTTIDIKATIAALLKGENPKASFYQICDENIAISNGLMDFNGDEYFLINGKYAYKLRPFEQEPEYFEEDYLEQVRTFRLDGETEELQLSDFRTWYDLDAFQDFYGPLIPENIRRELEKLGKRPPEQ